MSQSKYDNTIAIPYRVSIDTLKRVLFENGYSIEGPDTVYITTREKDLKKTACDLKIMIARMEAATYIKGQIKSQIDLTVSGVTINSGFESVEFRGMKGGAYRVSFQELDRIAKLLSSEVKYLKQ